MVVLYYYIICFGVTKLFYFEVLLTYYYYCEYYHVNLINGYKINNKISGFIFCSDTCMLRHIQPYNWKRIIIRYIKISKINPINHFNIHVNILSFN